VESEQFSSCPEATKKKKDASRKKKAGEKKSKQLRRKREELEELASSVKTRKKVIPLVFE